MDDSVGKRLASFRKTLGMSQRVLASALGVSPGRIGSIETDAVEPSRSFLQKISERYQISADWLLHGRGEMVSAGAASPVPPARIDAMMFMICANAVRKEYESASVGLSPDQQTKDAIWIYNELLARMTDPNDGDELEATLPQLRHILRKRLTKP